MKNNCDFYSEYKDQFGYPHQHKCEHKAKFQVEYKQGTTGERVKNIVCGVHKVSLEKAAIRLKKRLGYDYMDLITNPI